MRRVPRKSPRNCWGIGWCAEPEMDCPAESSLRQRPTWPTTQRVMVLNARPPATARCTGPPGYAYVYFIYGNHWCFNAVCGPAGVAEAVLIRAIEAGLGMEQMQNRRTVERPVELTNGPAKLCEALAIDRAIDSVDLCDAGSPVFIAENKQRAACLENLGPTTVTTRIGISKAAEQHLRFYLEGSLYVSKRVKQLAGGA